ncbi:phosphatidylinositol-specific phospholipase C domain-containing protein [Nocardiopsis halotolerans]|uniref:phosphatidylinositol-specific phospholipase C domain-containing protein n=1 Tax=Nocardiopsis halotolerans TaxID=124252 RepID=UPI00034D9C83|nr:phosphatidylinositol-specific phospholipase C domain-containing protein [Nocardiopsis halotolerans]
MPPARTAALTCGALVLALTALPSPASAAGPTLSQTTSVGVHNAYETGTFPYFADALDSGAGLLELDVWTDEWFGSWRVNHDLVGQNNNCAGASAPDGLRQGGDGDLADCLRDVRTWHEANPGHRPLLLKVELKKGFHAVSGLGPAEFDGLTGAILGDALLRPGDLLGDHATLDEAVRADGWPSRLPPPPGSRFAEGGAPSTDASGTASPSRDALAGKVIVYLTPGTFEQGNPFDDLWTDEEYATHLRDLAAEGSLDEAAAFPAVLGARSGDPRERYPEDLRPWFVVFDGGAPAYTGGIDTSWYGENDYLLVMTDAHAVSPPIDSRTPSEEEAAARVTELAEAGATTVTSDWAGLPGVLSMVVPHNSDTR